MIDLVQVLHLEPAGDFKLRIWFSDGQSGTRDFAELVHRSGPMVAPLRDPAYFARAFVQCGVPTWPNGFDLDAINLHRKMAAAGELTPAAAE